MQKTFLYNDRQSYLPIGTSTRGLILFHGFVIDEFLFSTQTTQVTVRQLSSNYENLKNMTSQITRRDFLKIAIGTAALAPLPVSETTAANATIPQQALGKTGRKVTIFGLGGSSAKTPLSNGQRDASLAIINRALELGVSYFDTAHNYNTSEEYLGEIVKTRRQDMFLTSKSDGRTRDAAWRDLELSLKRLQTDYLDLWQMHHVSLTDRDTDPAFSKDGAIKALEEAKAQKLVRLVGVTGHHDPFVLAEWLRRYPFDTLLAAINACDVHHPNSFIKNLLPVAKERKVPVIAMKIPAYGKILNPTAGITMKEAMHYSLSQEGVVTCVIGCDDVKMLEENVAAAKAFTGSLSKASLKKIEQATAGYWKEQQAMFYREWT